MHESFALLDASLCGPSLRTASFIEDYQAMRENPAPFPYLQQAAELAKFEPGMYEVGETYSPAD
jgi:hypothetical protein